MRDGGLINNSKITQNVEHVGLMKKKRAQFQNVMKQTKTVVKYFGLCYAVN